MSGVATSGGGGVAVASLYRHRKLPFPPPPPPPLQKGYQRLRSKDAPRRSAVTCFAMDTSSSGGMGNAPTFRRVRVWDPYKRLGVSKHASEEEIRGARNFLLDQYAWHERSAESIEAAYERIIMASFWKRKNEKINLKSRLRNKVEESPPWFKRLVDFFELPPTDIVLKRLALFVFLGAWSITNSAQNGPAFQVAISLGACIYFLNDKMKNVARASITGFAALAIGWVCGSILVPMIPSVMIPRMWPLELLTSLVAYVSLFLACTYLK